MTSTIKGDILQTQLHDESYRCDVESKQQGTEE